VLRFCEIANKGDLLVLESDLLKNRVFSEDVAKTFRDTKFGEARSEDFEW
jgi:hypothetical protein